MHLQALALPLILLACSTTAKHVCKSTECWPGKTSDCRAALDKMTNTGELGGNDHESWESGDCAIDWYPNGKGADAAEVHGVAEDLINTCCAGDKCAGISKALHINTGCVCIHTPGKTPCNCQSNSMTCAWPQGV